MRKLVCIVFLAAGFAAAQAPDSSKTNKRDRDQAAPTADTQQKATKADTEMARQIRKSVTADKSLSTYAHNVKIVVLDGKVTLRGPVRSQAESDAIAQKAAAIAGAANITNQLEVAPPKS